MKRFRILFASACMAASFISSAGEPPGGSGERTSTQPIARELQPLQGTWEGVHVGDPSPKTITITITGHSLHFHRDPNFWFETTFTLPTGKDPKQLHATIKGCPPGQEDSVGKLVRAFFKIEDGKLTLATIGDDDEETAKGFETAATRYELRKVQAPGKSAPKPKSD